MIVQMCVHVSVRCPVFRLLLVTPTLCGKAEQPQYEIDEHPDERTDDEFPADDAENAPRGELPSECGGQHDREHLIGCREKDGVKGTERNDAPGIQPRRRGGKAALRHAPEQCPCRRGKGAGFGDRALRPLSHAVFHPLHEQIGEEQNRDDGNEFKDRIE